MRVLSYIGLIICFLYPWAECYSQTQVQVIDTVCVGSVAEKYSTAPTPGSVYLWTVNGGNIISNNGASILVNWGYTPGIYSIRVVEISRYGCWGDTVSANILIVPELKVKIDGPAVICQNETALLRAQGAALYKWSDGTAGPVLLAKPNVTTEYTVIGYDGGCKPDTAKFTIEVIPAPVAAFSFSPSKPLTDEPIQFKYTGTPVLKYDWYFNDNDPVSDISDPKHAFADTGIKSVTLVVATETGCRDTVNYKIMIDFNVGIYIPTAFSPNGDNKNETFAPVCSDITEVEVKIYDRWGALIYTIMNTEDSWDGTIRGNEVPEGSYVYVLTARGVNHREYNLKGNVILMR
jgi:gliding motility-associated-like protein